jgi:predicted NBD/HSP70 family sugar kinase
MELALGRNHRAGKLYNRALILRLILNRGAVSRLTLSRLTRLSPAAVTILTGELIEEGLLIEQGGVEEEASTDTGTNRVGRRSTPLNLNPQAGRTLGVHITPRMVRVGLVNLKGELLDQEALGPADHQNPAATLQRIENTTHSILARNHLTPHDTLGIGVGAVGLVDAQRGINLRALSLEWENVPLKAELERVLKIPVYADNNVRGMALAELLFGYGRINNFRNLAVVYVGAGIGCGLVLEGELYRGSGDAAGEIGHMLVDPQGRKCYCGASGCLETIAGEIGLRESALRETEKHPNGMLAKISNGEPEIEHLLEAARLGDAEAKCIFEQAGEALGLAVLNLTKTLNPDAVILAGRIPLRWSPVVEKVRATLRISNAPPGPELNVVVTGLDDFIGVIGAAALALREFFYYKEAFVR